MLEQIKIIYDNKEILSEVLHDSDNFNNNRVFFSRNNSYIGIEQKYDSKNCKVIFIDGGVWQYNFTNTEPKSKEYISLDEYLDKLIEKIESHENYKK